MVGRAGLESEKVMLKQRPGDEEESTGVNWAKIWVIWVESTLGKADKRFKDFDAEDSFVC